MSEFTAPSVEELQANFPNHQIESFIAKGGMGAVYLATQTSLDRQVAIKILPKEFGEDADYRISFETEAKAMAKLNHTNLVGIFDFGDIDGMLYIIMEYIPGRSLFDAAHGQQVDQIEAARLIADMCNGLDHAHSAGMLHRDIKPANVLIDDEARPKIVDFGLARPLGEEQSDGVVFGTPGYTAPEVLSNPFAVDQRSDIFSMGVMLYEMLTAQLPGDPVMPASSITHTDVRFDAILAKAIHPDPDQRYHTAGEMAVVLEDLIKNFEYEAQEPVVEQHVTAPVVTKAGALPTAPPVVLKSASKGNGGLTLLLLAALAGGGYYYYKTKIDVAPEPVAVVEEVKEEVIKEVVPEPEVVSEPTVEVVEQKPEPVVEVAPVVVEEVKEPEPEVEKPSFDHEGFIEKEREKIKARAATVFRNFKEDENKLLTKAERSTKWAVRRSVNGDTADWQEEQVSDFFKEWKTGDTRPELPVELSARALTELSEFKDEVEKLDARFLSGIGRYQKIYQDVIKRKGVELKKAGITTSLPALQTELEALNESEYFIDLVSDKDN